MACETKKAIEHAFFRLLQKHSFDKITVCDIVEECGINRNTFYYHYKDIYDLLEQIVKRETKVYLEYKLQYDSWWNIAQFGITLSREYKTALYHLYSSLDRKWLENYLNDAVEYVMRRLFKNTKEQYRIEEQDFELIILFFRCAVVGVIIDWLDEGMKKNAYELVERLGTIVEGCGQMMLQKAEALALSETQRKKEDISIFKEQSIS